MTVTSGKFANVLDFPFTQLIGMAADATQARQAYADLVNDDGVAGLIVSTDKDIAALVLYRDEAGEVTIVSALAWRTVDVTAVLDEVLLTFSKARKTGITLMTTAEMDVPHLLQHGFVMTEPNVYHKTMTYPAAIVFGGGGAHGAFLTGAFDVLKEHGIVPSELLGVSVGAITGMSLMHFDPTLSKQTWAGLTTNMVYEVDEVGLSRSQFRKNLTHNLVSRQYFNKESLREVIRPVVAVELATPRLVDFTLLASEFPILKPVTYTVTDETTVDELTDWILASSAFYPFVSPVEIDGKRYIDGGYTNNVPVDVAAAHGAKEIYAISIMDNVPAASTVPDDVQVTVIRSPWELGPLLDFIPEESARHMRLGELRTRQVLGDLVGYYYAFEPSTSFAWLGGGSLIHWLASDPVTAGVANILSETAVWVAWTQWIGAHAESTVVNNPDAMGLATIERLGELLDVDPLAVYDESSFQTALVKAAKVNRDKLPLPEKAVTTAYVMANLAVVLTAVLYLLSNGQKNGRMVG